MQKCLSTKTHTICISNQSIGFPMIRALFTQRYSRTDHNAFSEIFFNKISHYIEPSQFIYVENQLTSFCSVQVSTEMHFWTVCSEITFSKNHTMEKPANLSPIAINRLGFIWCELTLKGISEQILPWGHLPVELSLARLFNSCWNNYVTVTGMILQQQLAQFFNRHWCNSSTVAGKIA